MTAGVPGALDGLKAIGSRVLPGVELTIGPNYDPGGDYLCIGWVDEHNPGVTVQSRISDAGLSQEAQDYDIHCAIAVHRGNEQITQAIAEAYAYYNAMDLAIRLDPRLANSVARATVGHSNLLLSNTEKGRMAALRFAVTVRTWK